MFGGRRDICSNPMLRPIRILAVVPEEWLPAVKAETKGINVEIVTAEDRRSAIRFLKQRPEIDVVLTASILPDGTWEDVLRDISKVRYPPEVVVSSRLGDASLWCDVLENGAFDLIAFPFVPGELQRTLAGALAYHHAQKGKSK